MPPSVQTQTQPTTDAVNAAFDALRTYDSGSSRAALLPLDDAVIASLARESERKALERRLVVALKHAGSVPAREYICSKLALIGTADAVAAVAALLKSPELATAARNALEVIPGRRAARALRDSLRHVEGAQKIGVINSLGARRDAGSARVLTALLRDPDAAMAAAAAAALGDIGTITAAKALREFLPRAPQGAGARVADAILNCADHLLAAGKGSEAETLYRALVAANPSGPVRFAAARALEHAAKP